MKIGKKICELLKALQGYIKHIDPNMIFLSDDFENIKCLPGAPSLFKGVYLGIK